MFVAFMISVSSAFGSPTITITSPIGGETWGFGEIHNVTWTSQGVDRVSIYVFNDSIFGSGSTNYLDPAGTSLSVPASQGYFEWTIIQSWLPKPTAGNEDRYKIKIHDIDTPTSYTIMGVSPDYFSIRQVPEPATIGLLVMGLGLFVRRKH